MHIELYYYFEKIKAGLQRIRRLGARLAPLAAVAHEGQRDEAGNLLV